VGAQLLGPLLHKLVVLQKEFAQPTHDVAHTLQGVGCDSRPARRTRCESISGLMSQPPAAGRHRRARALLLPADLAARRSSASLDASSTRLSSRLTSSVRFDSASICGGESDQLLGRGAAAYAGTCQHCSLPGELAVLIGGRREERVCAEEVLQLLGPLLCQRLRPSIVSIRLLQCTLPTS
jgi:hypothetical protein